MIGLLLLSGCKDSSSTGNKALDGELKLESNQSLMVAQVTAIYGNEITLALAKEVDASEMGSQMEQREENTTKEEKTESNLQDSDSDSNTNDNAKAVNTENMQNSKTDMNSQEDTIESSSDTITNKEQSGEGETESQEMPSGQMPSEERQSKDMPSRGGDSNDKGSSDKSENESQTQMTRYSLTGEETTMMIPVGTPVTTLLGTVTTFSRIAVDNTLKIVTEKNENGEDVITAIYIVG